MQPFTGNAGIVAPIVPLSIGIIHNEAAIVIVVALDYNDVPKSSKVAMQYARNAFIDCISNVL
jgi:hypothetical protein